MTSAPAIGFEYRHSPALRRARAGMVGLAALAIALCGAPWWARALGVLALGAWVWWTYRHAKPMPAAIGWQGDSGWTLRLSDGRDVPATLRSARQWGSAVALELAADGHRHALWLLPDNCDADTRRRLRMRLALLGAGDRGHA